MKNSEKSKTNGKIIFSYILFLTTWNSSSSVPSLATPLVLILKLLKSRLHTSLENNFGQPRSRLPTTNSLYNRYFGVRSAPVLRTWPSQRSLRWLRVKCMVVRLARLNTSSLVIFCCHAILRMRRSIVGGRYWFFSPARYTTSMFHYRISEYRIHRTINVSLCAND